MEKERKFNILRGIIMLHNIMNRVTNKDGRKGWSNNPTIPKIHVFNINGSSLNFMERNEV